MKKEIEDRFKAVVEMFEQLDSKLGVRDLFEKVMKDEAEYKLRNLAERVEKLEAMTEATELKVPKEVYEGREIENPKDLFDNLYNHILRSTKAKEEKQAKDTLEKRVNISETLEEINDMLKKNDESLKEALRKAIAEDLVSYMSFEGRKAYKEKQAKEEQKQKSDRVGEAMADIFSTFNKEEKQDIGGCMKHLRVDVYGITEHAQLLMTKLGITYQYSTPQSICDQWWFWNCSNIPEKLPSSITELNLDPMECIGYGLSKEKAIAIRDFKG